jgi:hypothetical protein
VNKNVRRAVIALVAAALVTVGLIIMGVRQSMGTTCEACVTFEGRNACRTASGATEQEATTTAIQNACALLASGMTRTVQCQNRPPDSVVCEP